VQRSLVGVAVLGLGCVLDGTSWLTSVRQLRREATARGVRFRQHLRSTTDTAVTAVYFEDAAALLGNAIALTGLGLHQADPMGPGLLAATVPRPRAGMTTERTAAARREPQIAGWERRSSGLACIGSWDH
jgi:hypothetical protein